MNLRQTIKEARKKQGYAQSNLASKIGVRQATISDFETGKHAIGSDILEKIMNALDLRIVNHVV